MLPRPNELFEEIASIITQATLRPFRDEPMTVAELDRVSDAILLYIQRVKDEEKK
jgi:hypothetical protein